MMKSVSENVRAYALAQRKAAYMMGATAEKCTPAYRRSLAAGRSSEYADKIIENCPVLSGSQAACAGCEHAGELTFDCAQLSRFAAAAGGVSLPSGSNSQWTKVSWAVTGEIANMPMDAVCFVFHRSDKSGRMTHVGVYLGDGTVVDARGHAEDVRHDDVASYPWTHFAIPVEIADEAMPGIYEGPIYAEVRRETIRRGSKGEAVLALQEHLNNWDPSLQLKQDGKFGAATLAAVLAFQAAHGLMADGIVGPNTWCMILHPVVIPEDEGPREWEELTLEEKIEDLHQWRLSQAEGGAANG